MKIRIQIIFEGEEAGNGQATPSEKLSEQVIELERSDRGLNPQTLGLNMSEAKAILAGVQQRLLRQ